MEDPSEVVDISSFNRLLGKNIVGHEFHAPIQAGRKLGRGSLNHFIHVLDQDINGLKPLSQRNRNVASSSTDVDDQAVTNSLPIIVVKDV